MKVILELIDSAIILSNYDFFPLLQRIINNYSAAYKDEQLTLDKIKVEYEGFSNYSIIKIILKEKLVSDLAAIIVTYAGIKDDITKFNDKFKTVESFIENNIKNVLSDSLLEEKQLQSQISVLETEIKLLNKRLGQLNKKVEYLNEKTR